MVRNFLRNNEKSVFTAYEVSKAMGINLKDVEAMIAMGLLNCQGSSSYGSYLPARPSNTSPSKKIKGFF